MNSFWQKIEQKLREMEAEETFDLFALGYIIPQIALAQNEADDNDSAEHILASYIESSMQMDRLDDSDIKLVRQALADACEGIRE